jgi:hypothetical protein
MNTFEDYNDIMKRMQQSDLIICNNLEKLHYDTKKENDNTFMQNFNKPIPNTIRDVSQEYEMWTETYATRNPYCGSLIVTRAGNNNGLTSKVTPLCAGYECFMPVHISDYLVTPSKTNTYQNYIIDNGECTSTHHIQLFNNMTKRK